MVPAARWLVVAALAVGLAATPALVRAVPASESKLSAPGLADRIRSASDRGWSGEVVTRGGLDVPITDSTFSGLARILGETSSLRVWWRDPEHWRVDRIWASGESDLVRDGTISKKWSYESRRLTVTPYSGIRLPDDADVVPPALARRMLQGAHDDELSKLPAQRIAGHDAAGLRLVPSDSRSTIDHVDVWADTATGIPLRVEVYADRATRPLLSTEMNTVDLQRPSVQASALDLDGVRPSFGRGLDAVAGANVFAPFRPPDRLVGLPRLGDPIELGAVGVYGRGPTAVLALPLRDFIARDLRDQLRKSKDSRETDGAIALEVGPMSVLLTRAGGGRFLLLGTVSPATLETAANRLDNGLRRTDVHCVTRCTLAEIQGGAG